MTKSKSEPFALQDVPLIICCFMAAALVWDAGLSIEGVAHKAGHDGAYINRFVEAILQLAEGGVR